MGHYRVLVILPSEAEEDDAEGYVEDLLAPYDENLTVDPYWEDCGCRQQRAWLQLADATAQAHGYAHWEAWREAMRTEAANQPSDVLYLDHVPAFRSIFQMLDIQAAQQAPETPADPNCPTCHGRGRYRTIYNPGARWDWWVIGGRWDDPAGNIRRLREWPADAPPIAVVTPDGTWHEQAEVGWFGSTHAVMTDAEWQQRWTDWRALYGDYWAVSVDCHI
ncbi:hypothetical protein TPY_1462 [Sulfobacillus acidophilus TPY]|uniref:Uncharacterized protein n=1 Tax=Sulfobacillus acidophilus (strain ATCC 700253 / DSM 10332 / NAL) TaxID=679936 RepID=G8U0H3_SULAD|nr:hypothetical protein TPY_1462 [Sulfobacillus acidophilus TPY]AEW04195.1 hypothetical protein Sulac_0687 [Sulfobacillus acidophilus DSM 10332]